MKTEIKSLETEFIFHGHHLRQLWRRDHVAVFARSFKPELPPHELELIVIRIKPGGITSWGSIAPEREAYPSSSEWGTYGWSFPVRYRDWVLATAEKLLGITKGYGTFMRMATTELKLSRLPSSRPLG